MKGTAMNKAQNMIIQAPNIRKQASNINDIRTEYDKVGIQCNEVSNK